MQKSNQSISVTPFSFESNTVRTVAIDGEIWFVAQDVLKALGYSTYKQPARIIEPIPDEWVRMNPIHTNAGTRTVSIISEQGLYFLLGRSDKPKALPFQKWLAGEVLPSIRKTGGYSVQQSLPFVQHPALPGGKPNFGNTRWRLNFDEVGHATLSIIPDGTMMVTREKLLDWVQREEKHATPFSVEYIQQLAMACITRLSKEASKWEMEYERLSRRRMAS